MASIFSIKKDTLIPETFSNVMFKDKNGNELSGDDFIRMSAKHIKKFEDKGIPVPVQNQKFVSWLKQADEMLSQGLSSDEIFEKTLIKGI